MPLCSPFAKRANSAYPDRTAGNAHAAQLSTPDPRSDNREIKVSFVARASPVELRARGFLGRTRRQAECSWSRLDRPRATSSQRQVPKSDSTTGSISCAAPPNPVFGTRKAKWSGWLTGHAWTRERPERRPGDPQDIRFPRHAGGRRFVRLVGGPMERATDRAARRSLDSNREERGVCHV